jgi:hypothetical protein
MPALPLALDANLMGEMTEPFWGPSFGLVGQNLLDK